MSTIPGRWNHMRFEFIGIVLALVVADVVLAVRHFGGDRPGSASRL